MTGCRKRAVGHVHDQPGVSLPVRAPDHARLTEPAAPRTAPGDFQNDAVVDGLHQRHHRRGGMALPVDIDDLPLENGFIRAVDGRNINPVKVRQRFEHGGPSGFLFFAPGQHVGDFHHRFFAFPDDKGVDEGGKGRGIERAGAARENEGMGVAPIG